MRFKLRMGVSGRHCHLKREDMDILFGFGSELHPLKPIVQPGQFTSEECVYLETDKGKMKLRVIGPLRPPAHLALTRRFASPVIWTALWAAGWSAPRAKLF